MKPTHVLAAVLCSVAAAPLAIAAPQFAFEAPEPPQMSDVVLYVGPDGALSPAAGAVDIATGNRVSAAMTATSFGGAFGETLSLVAMAPFDTVTVIGTGAELLTPRNLQDLGGHAAMATDEDDGLSIVVDGLSVARPDAAAFVATGYALGDYAFTKYKSDFVEVDAPPIRMIGGADGRELYEGDLRHLVEGVTLARDFGSEPGNAVWPQRFVETVREAFRGVPNVRINVLDANDIRRAGMGALMGVGQGSVHDPRLLIVSYTGAADRRAPPIALVGKGITFDTGGISLKPNDGMWAMKSDLSGAAAVAGTLLAVARRGEAINVVGLMPLAENMPSQDAIRPGDVLTTMSGQTIEIMSTDAEGRLILADAVLYADREFSPAMILNIATLTGSAARAVGDDYAAVITRDLQTSLDMMEIGRAAGEDVWPLPLNPSHFDQIESVIADIKNTGGDPGASVGAAFVGTFIPEDMPWVHLDMAGVDWRETGTPTAPAGHAGWGVRFMDELLRRNVDE